jgi:hypothetical protein
MSKLDDILDMDASDIVEPRKAPPGNYLAEIRNYKFAELPNENETPVGDLEVILLEPLDGQDMTGVNTARPLEWRGWLTEDGVPVVKSTMRRILGDAIDGMPKPRMWYENAVGQRIVAKVEIDGYAKKKRGIEKMIVRDFKAA